MYGADRNYPTPPYNITYITFREWNMAYEYKLICLKHSRKSQYSVSQLRSTMLISDRRKSCYFFLGDISSTLFTTIKKEDL